ncbi:MAG: glycine--tRNA ligase, partial [Gammaproteobacteria bacterium]
MHDSTTASTAPPGPVTDPASKSMSELAALCKRRGFVYPASEIYGGLNGFWDYGPLGTSLKNNIRDWWWRCMVESPPIGPDGEPVSIVGLDSAIVQNPRTWVASGHVGGFNDPMVDCTETKRRYRLDHVEVLSVQAHDVRWAFMENEPDSIAKKLKKARLSLADGTVTNLSEIDPSTFANIVAPDTDRPGTLTEPRQFNLMFETFVGAVHNEDARAYLRPETAQGIFLNFKNVIDTTRVKLPFGIAQIGKSFRNEVTPRNFIFRSREFEQMEMEFFCAPDESQTWYEFWRNARYEWWLTLGIDPANLILRDHDQDELSHYSSATVDIEYRYPFTAPGYGELEGIAHRGCFDLTQHKEHSGKDLSYFDQDLQVKLQAQGVDKDEIKKRSRYVPHVIEPAGGLTRAVLLLLCEAFTPDESRPSK